MDLRKEPGIGFKAFSWLAFVFSVFESFTGGGVMFIIGAIFLFFLLFGNMLVSRMPNKSATKGDGFGSDE